MNGSLPLGQCSSHVDIGLSLFCTEPATTVLFDGVIPTLTGLDGDMWASQLLTLETTSTADNTATVLLNFATAPTSAQVERVEIVMFHCPQWGISTQEIVINSFPDAQSFSSTIAFESCDSLVRVCTNVQAVGPQLLTINFIQHFGSSWVHLAEVTVYNDSSICPPVAIVDATTPPPPPAATTCTYDILPPVIAAVATALLATVIFVLLQVVVCKCCLKLKGESAGEEDQYEQMNGSTCLQQGIRRTGTSADEQEYEQMERYEGGVATSEEDGYVEVGSGDPNYVQIGSEDPNYVEVGLAGANQLEENEAYNGRNELEKIAGGNIFQVQNNIAYAVSSIQ